MAEKGTCFVIMGYGVKTDLATGRDLNLDKTYKNIIKPAAIEAGLECIRADEVRHSGIIDVPMYNLLINADVVIADLSTNNANAFYELGVRHALRPKSTIAISENQLKPPFDINHTVIHQYEHLGSDIGYDEVGRFRSELVSTINRILKDQTVDSPVYTYIKNLTPPFLAKGEEVKETISKYDYGDSLGGILEEANRHMKNDAFMEAKSLFEQGKTLDPNNQYILQKLTLSIYKSEYPNKEASLYEAIEVMAPLNIETTTDPETLGLAGAIYKRLWEEKGEESYLNKSLFFYEKGFYIKNDYYNGINLAFLYNIRGSIQNDMNYKIADYVNAEQIRKKVIALCEKIMKSERFSERNDKYWVLATLEEAYFGIGDSDKKAHFQQMAEIVSTENWERKTTLEQLNKISKLLELSPLVI